MAIALNSSTLVTVFGGSGFVGRYVVQALAKTGCRVRVAVRRPDLALLPAAAGRHRADRLRAGQSAL